MTSSDHDRLLPEQRARVRIDAMSKAARLGAWDWEDAYPDAGLQVAVRDLATNARLAHELNAEPVQDGPIEVVYEQGLPIETCEAVVGGRVHGSIQKAWCQELDYGDRARGVPLQFSRDRSTENVR